MNRTIFSTEACWKEVLKPFEMIEIDLCMKRHSYVRIDSKRGIFGIKLGIKFNFSVQMWMYYFLHWGMLKRSSWTSQNDRNRFVPEKTRIRPNWQQMGHFWIGIKLSIKFNFSVKMWIVQFFPLRYVEKKFSNLSKW